MQLIAEATEAKQRVAVLEQQEVQLREQIALYTEKYEEFQDTLSKSNEVFQSFKSETEKVTSRSVLVGLVRAAGLLETVVAQMAKKIVKLEKETQMWRKRWENSNKALLDMAEEVR